MVAHNVFKKILPHILIVSLGLWQYACASDQQQQGEVNEEVEGEQGNEEEAAASFGDGDNLDLGANQGSDFGAEELSNFNNLSNINDLANGVNDLATESAGASAAFPGNAQGVQDPITGGAVGMNAADGVAAGGETGGRVVRFVMNDAPVYGAPQASGTPVATMLQGDPVVVVVQGEWSQITDKHYIMTSALSEAVVPRLKTPLDWTMDQPSP